MKRYGAACILTFMICSSLISREQEFDIVYAINFFDGVTYGSTMVPYTSREISIQADKVNVFVVRETLIYYWPLVSEFRADWAVRNIPLRGVINIRDRRGNIIRIEPQRYVIQYDMNDIAGTIGVFWGDEADSKFEDFVRAQQAHNDAVFYHHGAMRALQQMINELLLNPPEETVPFPEIPSPPPPFTLLSTDVHIGFPVKLARGNYTMFFENLDGTVNPRTRKRLRVFEPRERVTGFQVFEEGRWTVPSNFPDRNMSLFTAPGSTLYLQPFNYLHFEARAYNLMVNPQNPFNRNESSIWVPSSLNPENLELSIAGKRIPLRGYNVTQLIGSRLGYVINPLEFGDRESSFSAFKFTIPQNSEGRTFRIGQTSTITVLRIFPGIEIVIITISLAPLLFFIINTIRRRK